MTMEGFFDFLIYGLLNAYTANTSMNGEILGILIAYFCLLMIILLSISLIYTILTKNEKQLANEEFKKRWGSLFEFLDTKNKFARIYNLIFVVRRSSLVLTCFYKGQFSGLILIGCMLLNLVYLIFIGCTKPFKKRSLNK